MSWQVFDRYAENYDAWFRTNAGRTLFPLEVEAVRLLLEKLSSPVLEVGVGSGAFAAALEVTVGVDPALGPLQIAKAKGVPVIRALGEALPFRNGVFGAVLLIVTLCFIEDPLPLLREAARVLKPEGGVIVADIIRDSPWGEFYLKKKAAAHRFYRYATFYTVAELGHLFAKAGLKVAAFSSTLTQPPGKRLRGERAYEGLVDNASFVCVLGFPTARPAAKPSPPRSA